jgi:hypothetical protein
MDQDKHSAITNIGAPCSADGQVANVLAFCSFMGAHLFGMEFRKSHGS